MLSSPHLRLLLLLCFPFFLTGCNASKWWIGKWQVDQEYTQKKVEEAQAAKPANDTGGNFLSGMADALGGMLIAMMGDITIQITDKEVITMQGGTGKSATYTVMERPTKDSVLIKQQDGEITTWYRDGEHLAITATGATNMKIYFRRVKE